MSNSYYEDVIAELWIQIIGLEKGRNRLRNQLFNISEEAVLYRDQITYGDSGDITVGASTLQWFVHESLMDNNPTNLELYKNMNISVAVDLACKQPTFLEALSWMADWENDRVVRQALDNKDKFVAPGLKRWDTCFLHCFKLLEAKWKETHPDG